MKHLAITLALILGISSTAFGALTAQEEEFVGQLLSNKSKLIELYKIADGLTNEKVPAEIATLRKDIQALVAARDAEILVVKQTAQANIQTIEATYEAQIDAKEASISNLQSQL